ncbi:uncharacterized protein LOC144353291 [Saccoglossus kowalevskii]
MILREQSYGSTATLVKENQTSLQDIAMIMAIFGGEAVFEIAIFCCPCIQIYRRSYSWMFIIGPSVSLFAIGVAISNTTWKLLSGCCRAPRGILDFCRPRYTCYGGCCGLVQVTAQATVAALVWIFIALMNVTGGLTLILMFIWRMCSTFTFEHKRYANIHNDIEKEVFVKKSKEIARANIQKTLDKFFDQEKLKCSDARSWGQVQNAWSKISFVGSEYTADYGYTPLHEWAIDEQENNNTENRKEPAQFNSSYGNSTLDTTENKEGTFEMRIVPNVST